ncbi:very short patch repair endonuclease [Pseudoalteromonas sp. DL2-H2.2]|uniref:very short patch repair endonuclease n=1 Tax=Pseudoalteromonas sp. DL2-H2.2 TaxID=2908889 RepID=UPI003FA74EA4
MDVHNRKTRSKNMRAISSTNTALENTVKALLEARCLKFVPQPKHIPGNPDFFVNDLNIAIFCHGCFWHAHDCALFKLPGTRKEFWQAKLHDNTIRDKKALCQLHACGIRTLVIWGCAVKGKEKLPPSVLPLLISTWLQGMHNIGVIDGTGLSNFQSPQEVTYRDLLRSHTNLMN